MKKDCIKDFIDSWSKFSSLGISQDWDRRFKDAGYFDVDLGLDGLQNWPDVHSWCMKQYGKRHYSWVGSKFWFESEEDSIIFALRWA